MKIRVLDVPTVSSAPVHVHDMECCGLGELSGLQSETLPRLRAALGFARVWKYGVIIATSTNIDGEEMAKDLGFGKAFRFLNPNSGNIVTVWLGQLPEATLKEGK